MDTIWQVILQLAFPYLDLTDVRCLSLTSKAAGQFILDRLAGGNYQHARDLLFSAVDAEARIPAQACAGRQQLMQQAAVEWLLDVSVIPPESLALDSTRYLCISNASYRKNLLGAGLKVTYEAVVTAAKKVTRYLYQWIEDCEECDIELQINHITRAACCSDQMEMDSSFLSTPDVIVDHLYITLNCICGPCDVVERNACRNIIALCSLPAAAEITAEAIEPLLHAAVQVFRNRDFTTMYNGEVDAIGALCWLDATNRLSNAALYGLLKAAAETMPTREMLPLFEELVVKLDPAPKVEVILTLYRALIAADSKGDLMNLNVLIDILGVIPGMPEASRASLFKALFVFSTKSSTWDHRAAWLTSGVLSVPGMCNFSTTVLVDLLRYVLETGAKDHQLPETAIAIFVGLLGDFPGSSDSEAVEHLLQLTRTRSYSSDTIDKLLQLQGL